MGGGGGGFLGHSLKIIKLRVFFGKICNLTPPPPLSPSPHPSRPPTIRHKKVRILSTLLYDCWENRQKEHVSLDNYRQILVQSYQQRR